MIRKTNGAGRESFLKSDSAKGKAFFVNTFNIRGKNTARFDIQLPKT